MSNSGSVESIERFFSLSLHLLLIADLDGTVRRCNPAWQESLGIEPEQLVGRSFFELVHPDDLDATREEAAQLRQGRVTALFVNRYRHRDGSWRTLAWSAVAAQDAGLIYAIAQDVTEQQDDRRLLALQAKRAEALLELPRMAEGMDQWAMLEHALGLIEALTESRIGFAHFVGPSQTSIEFGHWSRRTLQAGCEAQQDHSYPLDNAGLWADAIRQRAAVILNDYPACSNGKGLPPGHISVTRALTAPVFEGDRIRMLFGVGNKAQDYDQTDIESAQLIANEAWRLAQQMRTMAQLKLADQVIAETQQGVAITDTAGRLVRVNAAFERITGYSRAEAIGQNPRILKSDRHDAGFYRRLWTTLTQRGSWRGEIWNRRKSGEIYPEWLSISAVTDAQGKLSHYVGLFHDLTEFKQAQQQIDFLARHDALTGLGNRAMFTERVEHALTRAGRRGRLAVLHIDLDRFKQINDILGHRDGDKLLLEVVRRIVSQLLPSDTAARLGSDEFAILLEERADALPVAALAQDLLHAIAEPMVLGDQEVVVTACIGISLYPEDGTTADSLARHASHALGAAKREGHHSFQFFERSLTEGALERMLTEHALRRAVERNELELVYQPQVRLTDGQLVGLEALVRWHHPEMGTVSPAQFIPLAEEIGIIDQIGTWVLETACQQLAAWDQAGLYIPRMAVNLSARQLDDYGLSATVAAALRRHRIQPQRLELEVTESLLMRDPEAARALVSGLKTLGTRISIDDFGTGYSSLAMLRLLPLDQLKIDQSFVRDIDHNDDNAKAIVRTVIAMARTLGLETVAEGIEDSQQRDFMHRERVDIGQGYLFAKPMPADDVALFTERTSAAAITTQSRPAPLAE